MRAAALYDIHGNLPALEAVLDDLRREDVDVIIVGAGPFVVCGHTHMPFDRTIAGVRVLNAGSVGMPFGEPGAWWLLLGPDVRPRCTPYDHPRAADRIRATAYPDREEFATRSVLQPPSEREMLDLFGRADRQPSGAGS